jgi:hypothetical protein
MFSSVVVDHSFKSYLHEYPVFCTYSRRVGITHVTCAVRKDIDVALLSVLLCMHHWL